nr:MAG TPA: hypothetical protein [Caudoviricetes sp.]
MRFQLCGELTSVIAVSDIVASLKRFLSAW